MKKGSASTLVTFPEEGVPDSTVRTGEKESQRQGEGSP